MSDDGQGSISERRVLRYRSEKGELHERRDSLVTEAPLELCAHGETLTVIMRTPGQDLELLRGLLHAEKVLLPGDAPDCLRRVDDDRVELRLSPEELERRWSRRSLLSSASCGVCGTTSLAKLETTEGPLTADISWSAEAIMELPRTLRPSQPLFEKSGGLHGAGLFDPEGRLLALREDVGRHNAVDKLVGWALEHAAESLPSSALCVSGRASFEIVQKAIAARIPVIVAVSAASSLAVDLAERWRVTLVGFVRDSGFNIYSHGSRIVSD